MYLCSTRNCQAKHLQQDVQSTVSMLNSLSGTRRLTIKASSSHVIPLHMSVRYSCGLRVVTAGVDRKAGLARMHLSRSEQAWLL